MSRILGILILILAILLFPPSVLALISNNAVPGDMTYPVKIKLEDGIVFLASFNPNTKAWFSVTRSNRRFEETTSLLAQGKSATDSLNSLVSQTGTAVSQISQLENLNQKEQLITDLQKSIEKYDQGLKQAQQQIVEQIQVTPTPTPVAATPLPTPESVQIPLPTPQATIKPQSPSPIVQPSSSPAPVHTPIVQPVPDTTITNDQREEIRRREEEIRVAREKLETERKKLEEERRRLEQEKKKAKSSKTFRLFNQGETKQLEEEPTTTPTTVCHPDQLDYVSCRRCASDGSFWGEEGSDFGPNSGSGQWCNCAKKYASDFSTSPNYSVCQTEPSTLTPQ